MSLKFSSLVFLYFLFIQSSNAFFQIKDFPSLLGSCPNRKGVTNFELIKELNGKWFTHWTTGKFSPWNHLQCQSHEILASTEANPIMIESRFNVPLTPVQATLSGLLEPTQNGQFDVTYYNSIFGNFHQKMSVVGGDLESGIIVWTCLDFKFFHLETTMAMSKSKHLDEPLREQLETIMSKFGIPEESLAQIDQKNCEDSFSKLSSDFFSFFKKM